MTPGAGSTWELVFFEIVRRQLRAWANQAADLGLRDQYAEALRTMVARLEADPTAWGDPQYRLRHLDLMVYRGFATFFYATYAVDEVRWIVYVSQVIPVPGRGLDSSGGTAGNPG
jgi:hypothetical protein